MIKVDYCIDEFVAQVKRLAHRKVRHCMGMRLFFLFSGSVFDEAKAAKKAAAPAPAKTIDIVERAVSSSRCLDR